MAEFVIVDGLLRCQACGALIGVYEPGAARDAGRVWRASIAAEPTLSPMVGEHYHERCYRARLEDTFAS
jgi:hypothetical protein